MPRTLHYAVVFISGEVNGKAYKTYASDELHALAAPRAIKQFSRMTSLPRAKIAELIDNDEIFIMFGINDLYGTMDNVSWGITQVWRKENYIVSAYMNKE